MRLGSRLRFMAAVLISFLVAGNALQAGPETPGIVILAHGANLGNSSVSTGTSLYDGDRVLTDGDGLLRLSSGTSLMDLGSHSSAILRRETGESKGTQVEISAGTLVFSVPQNATTAVTADGASIRALGNMAAVDQIKIISDSKFEIFARRGALKVSYRGDTETIPEGKSYRVELDRSEEGASAIGRRTQPHHSARKPIVLVLITGIIIATGVTLMKDMESPDCPQAEQCSKE
jgi:hypothetical protein